MKVTQVCNAFCTPPVNAFVLTGHSVFRALAQRWRMPVELALDLVALALYDIVIYADDSTSMKYAENGSRIDDMKVVLERVTEVATLFDADGTKLSPCTTCIFDYCTQSHKLTSGINLTVHALLQVRVALSCSCDECCYLTKACSEALLVLKLEIHAMSA